ncbi:MAG: hypothetical protein KME47_25835 [Nodosilinea sp. WJT8-NPBG4]|jgi:hypothetical protein|nr:hypothetical protein [Nodosilinea sp. WJT8-NPBG4]
MNPTFLTVARQGRNGWKRYLAGTLLALGVTLIIATPVTIISAYISDISIENEDLLVYGNPIRTIVLFGSFGAASLLGLFLAVTRVHRRKFMTLFNLDTAIDWFRVIKGLIVWLGSYGISFFVWYLISPSRYSLTFNISEWLPFALLVLVVAPILSLLRVLFLYAYLLQAAGLLIRHPLLLSIVWSLIVGSLSINLKMPRYWILSVAYSMFITWIVIKDNRLELAIGLVIADSLIFLLFISSSDSLIQTPTVFKSAGSAHFLAVLVTYVLRAGLFYFICFSRRRNLSASTID